MPKTKKETIKNAFGYTMDLKTGVYAFMNIAGFYIDTSWIGNKMPGSEFSGLYWGVKNLVAKCSSCGNTSCVSQSFNDLFDKAKKTLGMDGTKFRLHKLLDTEHVSKDSISSLDKHMNGTDMPTGNIEDVCVVRPRNGGPKFRRGLFGGDDDDDKKRDPCKAYNQADP